MTVIEVAELLVSELVTNAVAHAQSAPVMRIDVSGHAITVAVQDDAPGPVAVQDAPKMRPEDAGCSWSIRSQPRGAGRRSAGKRVWFTL